MEEKLKTENINTTINNAINITIGMMMKKKKARQDLMSHYSPNNIT